MKSVKNFIRATLTGGVLFLLPVALLIVVMEKPFTMLLEISEPLSQLLPNRIFGVDGRLIVAFVILVFVCFASGLLFLSPRIKKAVGRLEESVLIHVPGYFLVKSMAADFVGENLEHKMNPVLVQDGDALKIGFLVEEGEGLCTIFFPDAPRLDAGEVKIVPAAAVERIDVPSTKVAQSLKNFGRGALYWRKKDTD
ncbi:MAG: hypothetical protein AB9903_17600 [Vulcanimicrobiota bacterium]